PSRTACRRWPDSTLTRLPRSSPSPPSRRPSRRPSRCWAAEESIPCQTPRSRRAACTMYNPSDPATPQQDAQPPCGWCGQPKSMHAQLEATGAIHHKFSTSPDGGMTIVQDNTPGVRPAGHIGSTPVIIAPAPDLALRMLMRDVGLITPEQFDGLR